MRIKYYLLLLVLSTALVVVGGLLKILHWSNSQNILNLGLSIGGLIVVIIFVKIVLSIKKRRRNYNR